MHTIKTIENNKMELKKYQIASYVAEMQKNKLMGLEDLGRYLLVLSQYQNGFFQFEEFRGVLD
jgi:hypothetical protein